MRLQPVAMAYASAAVWGVAALLVGTANVFIPSYGGGWLDLLASIYPGYRATGTFGSALIVTGYAIVDGAVSGWLFAWLYNRVNSAQQ